MTTEKRENRMQEYFKRTNEEIERTNRFVKVLEQASDKIIKQLQEWIDNNVPAGVLHDDLQEWFDKCLVEAKRG